MPQLDCRLPVLVGKYVSWSHNYRIQIENAVLSIQLIEHIFVFLSLLFCWLLRIICSLFIEAIRRIPVGRICSVSPRDGWRGGLVVNTPDYHSRCRGFNPRPRHWKFEKYLAVFPTQLGDQVLVRNPGNMCLPCIGAVHWARKRTKESIRKELQYRTRILCITLLPLRTSCPFSEKSLGPRKGFDLMEDR
jgi:hypothetical protein